MLKKSDPKFMLETVVGRMRAGARRARALDEVSARVSESQHPTSFQPGPNQFEAGPVSRIVLQPSFQPRSDDHYHVNDLLMYHDRAFVQNAYRAILKRGPDATGFREFIDALRGGRLNKIDVLARLRYSAEGRAKRVQVEGLFFPAGIRLLYRVPLLGYLLNLAVGLARLPTSIRNGQKFQAHVLAQQEIIAEHANHVAEALSTLSAELAGTFTRSQQGFSEMHRQQIDALTIEQAKHFEIVAGERQAAREELARRLAEMNERFETAIHAEQAQVFSQLSHLSKTFAAAVADERVMRERTVGQLGEALEREQTACGENLDQLTHALQEEQTAREEVFHTLSQRLAALSETGAEAFGKELAAEMQKLFQTQQEVRSELALQSERVARLLDEAGRRSTEPVTGSELEPVAAEADHALDAFYLSLENQFRGSRAEIKQRLRAYLPLVKEAAVGSEQAPILDVGCGRGEWLSLLGQQGLTASGVDSNHVMIQQCRKLRLKVTEADLMDHLQGLPDASVGAITGFHVIEHLPIETLVRLLNETVRVVKPGGLVIFETPNPQNVLVGTCNFYFDPTHRNPLPSPIMKFLLQSRGFTGVEVLNLNPSDETPVAGDSELVRRFNQYFYGPMDYAVVGRRP